MAEETSQIPPVTPPKKEPPKAVQDFLSNIRNKSIRRLAQENAQVIEKEKEKPIETSVTPETPPAVVPETPPATPETSPATPPATPSVVETPPAPKPEELITKTAKETATEVAKELAKIQSDKATTEAEKTRKTEELKAKWTGVDKEGNAAPANWEEVVTETNRINEEKMKQFYKEQKEQELTELQKVQKEDEDKKTQEQKDYEARVKVANDNALSELDELYALGKLTKPKDLNDKNDPDAQKVQDLFKQAIAYNETQKAAGKPLVASIAKFFLLYYRPTEATQPPGAEAPVAGAQAAPSENNERLDYMRDVHRPSFRQIMMNARRKIGGK